MVTNNLGKNLCVWPIFAKRHGPIFLNLAKIEIDVLCTVCSPLRVIINLIGGLEFSTTLHIAKMSQIQSRQKKFVWA